MVQLVVLCRQINTRLTLLNDTLVLPNKALMPLYTCLARPWTLFGRIILFSRPTSVALDTKIRCWLLQLIHALCLKSILHLHAGPRRAGVHKQRTRLRWTFNIVHALTRISIRPLVRCLLTLASVTQRARGAKFRAINILPWVPIILVQPILIPRIKN